MKSGKGHDSGENSKEVWAIGGEGIDAEGGEALEFFSVVNGPGTQFEAVLVGNSRHRGSEKVSVHVDPVAAEGGSLAHQ